MNWHEIDESSSKEHANHKLKAFSLINYNSVNHSKKKTKPYYISDSIQKSVAKSAPNQIKKLQQKIIIIIMITTNITHKLT